MRLFKKRKSKYDNLKDKISGFLVYRYRSLAEQNDCAPTEKTSDKKIIDIYKQVHSSFREAAKRKGEYLSAGILNRITLKFYQVYELGGDEQLKSHLDYEIGRYLQFGLREEYRNELNLF